MIYVKYMLVILSPWLAFFLGDELYGSSHLIFHHPCESIELGCLRIDFTSFVIKGALFGSIIGAAKLSSYQRIASIVSGLALLVLIIIRLGAVQMEGVLNAVLEGYYWVSIYIPVILSSVLFYFGSKYVSGKLLQGNRHRQ